MRSFGVGVLKGNPLDDELEDAAVSLARRWVEEAIIIIIIIAIHYS